MQLRVWDHGRWVTTRIDAKPPCSYPPLSAWMLYGSGLVFRGVSGDRTANTVTLRAVVGGWSIVCDFVLAAGCAALVSHFRPGPAKRWAYVVMVFLPPIWWDTIIWGQVDTTVLAPLVWMVWAMARQRWVLAGVLLGMAAMVKPQGILILPVWGYAVLVMRPIRGPLLGLAAAGATAAAISLPFTLHGGLTWVRACYTEPVLVALPATTLKAFNLWYVDLLRCESDEVTATLLGISKDAWGKILLAAGAAWGFAWTMWRWGRRQEALVLLSAWTLLACVMLPTRIHERYVLVALPVLVAAAMRRRSLWPGVVRADDRADGAGHVAGVDGDGAGELGPVRAAAGDGVRGLAGDADAAAAVAGAAAGGGTGAGTAAVPGGAGADGAVRVGAGEPVLAGAVYTAGAILLIRPGRRTGG